MQTYHNLRARMKGQAPSTWSPVLKPRDATVESFGTGLVPNTSVLNAGITSMWLPPGCKASDPRSNGYDIYDLYDLGEFEWKKSKATKWGSKADLVELGRKAEEVGIGLLWDAVLNHRASADGSEKTKAVAVDPKNRTIDLPPAREVETWTLFNYPIRNGQYSTMKYNWRHFSGIDWDHLTRTKSILRFTGDSTTPKPGWANDVDSELGNYDYLMFADLDHTHPDVQADILNWSTWLPTQFSGLRGLRLDAIKHYSARFQYQLIKHLRSHSTTKDWFFVGEYWRADSKFLASHIDAFADHLHLFDVQLVYNFSDFAAGRIRDLRKILHGSLVELKPNHAVTFVTNHDTQATQSLAAPVLPWFHPHAYSLTLLRNAGIPCIFHGDVFGTLGPQPLPPSMGHRLMRLAMIRKLYAYGKQHDYFVKPSLIGWTREGHGEHGGGNGIAVVLNSGWGWDWMEMDVGRGHAGEEWVDLLGWSWDVAVVDQKGKARFRIGPRGVGVWTSRDAVGREVIDQLVWPPMVG